VKPIKSIRDFITVFLISAFGLMSSAHALPLIDDPGPLLQVEPKVMIGYMFPITSSALTLKMLSDNSPIQKLSQSSKIDGLWTEVVLPVRAEMPIGFTASFGYLVPGNYQTHEIYHVGGQLSERTWNTRTTLFNLKFTIDFSFHQSVTGILGFHYDSFMTTYSGPEKIVSNLLSFSNDQVGRLNVTGGSPFAGAMIEHNVMGAVDLKSYFIGYPGLPCVISYEESFRTLGDDTTGVKWSRELSSGYFLEGFAQVSMRVWRGIGGGAFAKYTEYFGKGEGTSVTHKNPVTGSTGTSGLTADFTFTRSNWIFGGLVSIRF
jgi:hypothetical protein